MCTIVINISKTRSNHSESDRDDRRKIQSEHIITTGQFRLPFPSTKLYVKAVPQNSHVPDMITHRLKHFRRLCLVHLGYVTARERRLSRLTDGERVGIVVVVSMDVLLAKNGIFIENNRDRNVGKEMPRR